MKVAFTLAYNGTHFLGSQTQRESNNTILGNVTQVFQALGIKEKIVASGRTDKGVHATGQVCHITLPKYWSDLKKLQRTMNKMLPSSIMVRSIKPVDDTFHARYSAKRRVYRYIIKTCQSNPFEAYFVTFLPTIDMQSVFENIGLFEGRHDFSGFMKTGSEVSSTERIIYKAFAYKHKGHYVLYFEANGFLRSQIRLMVGALLELNAAQIEEKLTKVKEHKVRPAPPNGLYLAKIKY